MPSSSSRNPGRSGSSSRRGACGGAVPIRNPAHEVSQCGLPDVVLLGTRVDRPVRLADKEVGGRPQERGELLRADLPVVVASRAGDVAVRVRRSRHLPHADAVRVGLVGAPSAEEHHVGLALQDQDRNPDVRPDRLPARRNRLGDGLQVPRRLEDSLHRHAATGSAVDEEAVEDLGQRIDRVDVGHQARGGLRLAQGEDTVRAQVTEGTLAGGQPEQTAGLGEHVERPGVARVLQAAVALWVEDLEV